DERDISHGSRQVHEGLSVRRLRRQRKIRAEIPEEEEVSMTFPNFEPIMDQLRHLIDQDRGNDAISMIEQLEEPARSHTDVMRLKSIAHTIAGGGINEAYAILRELATRPESSIEDLYWAGQRAAEFCDYKDAEAFLTSAINRSKKESDSYYLNCALLL